MQLYDLNDEFLSSLYRRIQLSIEEATAGWKTDIRANTFIYKVVTTDLSPILSMEALAELVQTCVFASLEREEGEPRPFSITIEPPDPDQYGLDYEFQRHIPFNRTNLIKFATALDSNDYHIGVWIKDREWRIWGFKPKLVWFLSLSSVSPGTISLSCLSSTQTAFKCSISLPGIGFLNPLSPASNPIFSWLRDGRILSRINKITDLGVVLSRMQQGGHGGGILLVPQRETDWRESIELPLLYEPTGYIPGYGYPELVSKYEVIAEWEYAARAGESDPSKLARLKERLRVVLAEGKRSLEDIYKLTRVDNAVILSDNLRVMAFGARIIAQKEIQRIAVSEPFDSSTTEVVEFASWNVGNRHKSAAKFVNEQRNCLGLVVSEDRRISLLSWDDDIQRMRQLRNFEAVILR